MFVRNKRQGCPALMWLLTKANSTIICTWYGPWKLEIPKDTMYVPSKTQTVKSWITLDRPIWNIYIWIDVGIFHPIFLIRARVFLSKRSSYVTALFSVRAAPPYQSFWRALNHLRGLGGRWTQVEPAKWFNGAQGRSSSTHQWYATAGIWEKLTTICLASDAELIPYNSVLVPMYDDKSICSPFP